MSKTEIYPQLVSRARKSLRKLVSALRACKALYQTVQIFLLQYLFVISHRGWWALLCLQMRWFARAIRQLTEHWILWNNTHTTELHSAPSAVAVSCHYLGAPFVRSPQFAKCTTAEIEDAFWKYYSFCGLWKFMVLLFSVIFFVFWGCCGA